MLKKPHIWRDQTFVDSLLLKQPACKVWRRYAVKTKEYNILHKFLTFSYLSVFIDISSNNETWLFGAFSTSEI